MIKISAEIPQIKIDTAALPNLQTILAEEMLNVRARLIADTQAGRTADGGALKPYSSSYIKAIDSGRIFGKAPGAHTPNLTATGELMRATGMPITPIQNGVEMRFSGSHAPKRTVSHEGAAKKRKLGGIVERVNGRSASRAAKPSRPRTASSSRSVPKALIAAAQYTMGRTGWFSFSEKDRTRIATRIRTELGNLAKNLFK
jgi:hypothetical protein